MKPRLVLDTATGQADLAWALVQLFFLMAFIATRPAAGLIGDPTGEGSPSRPIHIRLLAQGELAVVAPGDARSFAPPLDVWLREACQDQAPLVLECSPEVNHGECRQALARLAAWGPGCRFSY